jgi:ElaB/YqjD/DUF883 family membrane-anchored ribosome-binding protein
MVMADTNLDKDIESLKENVANLRSDISQITQSLLEKGKSETEVAKDRLIDELKFELEAARSKGRQTVENVESQIQEKPFMSLLIAFIVGLVLGKLFDKK